MAANSAIYARGDIARYTGEANGCGESFIVAGDEVLVIDPNEDSESDCIVILASAPRTSIPFFVSPADLEFIRSA